MEYNLYMEYNLNILYDEIDIIINKLDFYDTIKLLYVNKFFNNKINKFKLKINNMNKKFDKLYSREISYQNNYINYCINHECNIKHITDYSQKVLGLININEMYNFKSNININKKYNKINIRFIPYCLCCTNTFIITK